MVLGALLISLILTTSPPTESEQQALQAAQSHFAAGRYVEAQKLLTAALEATPQDAAVNYWLARTYYEQHNYDKAVTYAEDAVKLAPRNPEYQRWLGRVYGAKAEESRSFFLARKVKQAFEAAVRLAPLSIEARRDLMQYLAEAPWIVGGDKGKAREQVQAISQIDPMEGRLAQAAYLCTQKKWNEAKREYLAVLDKKPLGMNRYMEAVEFLAARKNPINPNRVLAGAGRVSSHDPRLDFYRGVVLILRGTELPTAEKLLTLYIAQVPERSDYPSHNRAKQWLGQK